MGTSAGPTRHDEPKTTLRQLSRKSYFCEVATPLNCTCPGCGVWSGRSLLTVPTHLSGPEVGYCDFWSIGDLTGCWTVQSPGFRGLSIKSGFRALKLGGRVSQRPYLPLYLPSWGGWGLTGKTVGAGCLQRKSPPPSRTGAPPLPQTLEELDIWPGHPPPRPHWGQRRGRGLGRGNAQ